MDLEQAINKYIEKMKESNKPFCLLCFDQNKNILKLIEGNWYCDDCLYMRKKLSEVKKV
jgi:late competence protein required for DNA uptake (superfamily II DNA/RNA helicase)